MDTWKEWTAGQEFERAEGRAEPLKPMTRVSGHERFIKVVEGLLWGLEQIDEEDLTAFEYSAKECFCSLLGKDDA